MTSSELAARELQARIMGWEPVVEWDCVVDVPAPKEEPTGRPAHGAKRSHYGNAAGVRPGNHTGGLDRSEY